MTATYRKQCQVQAANVCGKQTKKIKENTKNKNNINKEAALEQVSLCLCVYVCVLIYLPNKRSK